MNTSKLILIVLLTITTPSLSPAQQKFPSGGSSSYNTAIGLRAGGTSGVTFKKFLNGPTAVEVIAGVWPYGFSGTVLLEKHANAGMEGLNWYYGGGGHATIQTGRVYYRYDHPRYKYYYATDQRLGLGVDGIIGLEYKIKPIPFALSIDLKPFIEVNTGGYVFVGIDPGLGIKVAF